MKRILSIIILSFIIILAIALPVKATSEMSQLRLKVINATEDYDMYILLPKNYIKYAIQYDGLDIGYDGANTLKYNVIPSITVDINKVQDKTYIDGNIEYVQIKLDDLGEQEYLFEIITEYTDMDMLFRVKSSLRDNLMIIDNFTFEDNVCEMEYDYEANTISTERKSEIKLSFHLEWWQVLVIIMIVLGLVYFYNRRSY